MAGSRLWPSLAASVTLGAYATQGCTALNEMTPSLAVPQPATPDLDGEVYIFTMLRIHQMLRPKTYLEIGVLQGHSLALARCPTIAVDPQFQIAADNLPGIFAKPDLHFYQTSSDDFFARHDPARILGASIDFAFLDGMHRCEYLLRDFINTERHCKRNSIVALHDCLPVEPGIASRIRADTRATVPHRAAWWTGDVWRTALLLRRYRPDLNLTVLDCAPSGLILVTNLDPGSTILSEGYADLVEEMLSWDLAQIGIPSLFDELRVESTRGLQLHEDITQRFWL